jgi:hypothetical protein
MPTTLKHAVCFVAVANLAYFGVEFAVALSIGSVSLFADSIDFLEDAAVNLLILVALRWSARARARLGVGLAGILLIPRRGDHLDGVGKIHGADRTFAFADVSRRTGGAGDQPILCHGAREVQGPCRQPVARCILVSP